MIAHVSIPSLRPRETSLFFASLIGGVAFEFPVVPGAWVAVASDGSGLAIEVYPDAMAHHAGDDEDQIFADGAQVRPTAFHVALTTALSANDVATRARAEGWQARACDRAGVFGVIEVWVDGTVLVEVLTATETARYRAFMNPAGCAGMFGEPHVDHGSR